MCFPGFPSIPGFSCSFQRTTQDQTDGAQSSTNPQSIPLVTQQPHSTQSKTELKISFGKEDGVESAAAQIETIVNTTQHIIHNPQVQKGCMVCYDHCNDPCVKRCGCFGSWFCACFKACCILETPVDTNIPDIMRNMDHKYGPLSLAMAIQQLSWDAHELVKQGQDLSTDDEKKLDQECKKAKKQLTGSFNNLSQKYFHNQCMNILDDPQNVDNVLPTLLKIMGNQAWKNPEHKPHPPKCWVLEAAAKTDSTLPSTPDPMQLDLRRPSFFLQSQSNEDYTQATATRYNKKKMTKYLSKLEVASLETGAIGCLGAKDAHLVTVIFEIFLCLVAGENSPLVTCGGSVSFDINSFIKLMMLILLCCGYVPVDQDGTTEVKHDDPENPFVKIYKRSLRSYTQKQQQTQTSTTAPAPTKSSLEAVGGARPKQKTITSQQTSEKTHVYAKTTISTTSTTTTGKTSPLRHKVLTRQHSVNTPMGDYEPDHEGDWLKKMIDGEDDDEIFQQRQLLASSGGLQEIFTAMKKFNSGM
ncbi:hypothetical protein C834K_0322 [Chlamydia poikilotherma]|uniref:Uncharacterized protein n=1 Tax=Chlamydia poikilotherma TaxID=1967783 RepID=A0A3B0Q751_9CHLA|nr:hypothetical protein [Chlamydia poikilotherma]SYX08787.1 hypothetical protein C834K_0322 [Chlamydia poikilotherma]